MATSTEVDAALAAVAQLTSGSGNQYDQAGALLLSARNQLANIGVQFADEIATIIAYTPTGTFEEMAKDRFAKYSVDVAAQRSTIETILDAMGIPYT